MWALWTECDLCQKVVGTPAGRHWGQLKERKNSYWGRSYLCTCLYSMVCLIHENIIFTGPKKKKNFWDQMKKNMKNSYEDTSNKRPKQIFFFLYLKRRWHPTISFCRCLVKSSFHTHSLILSVLVFRPTQPYLVSFSLSLYQHLFSFQVLVPTHTSFLWSLLSLSFWDITVAASAARSPQ